MSAADAILPDASHCMPTPADAPSALPVGSYCLSDAGAGALSIGSPCCLSAAQCELPLGGYHLPDANRYCGVVPSTFDPASTLSGGIA